MSYSAPTAQSHHTLISFLPPTPLLMLLVSTRPPLQSVSDAWRNLKIGLIISS